MVLSPEGGWTVDMGPPLTKKLLAVDTYWQSENQFFSDGVSLGTSTSLQGRPHAQE